MFGVIRAAAGIGALADAAGLRGGGTLSLGLPLRLFLLGGLPALIDLFLHRPLLFILVGKQRKNENPDDYSFIPATVEDNPDLLQSSPAYLQNLAQMPEEERGKYYGEMEQHRDAIAAVRPYMNRMHRLLFGMAFGKRCWMAKAAWLCRLDQKKHA